MPWAALLHPQIWTACHFSCHCLMLHFRLKSISAAAPAMPFIIEAIHSSPFQLAAAVCVRFCSSSALKHQVTLPVPPCWVSIGCALQMAVLQAALLPPSHRRQFQQQFGVTMSLTVIATLKFVADDCDWGAQACLRGICSWVHPLCSCSMVESVFLMGTPKKMFGLLFPA